MLYAAIYAIFQQYNGGKNILKQFKYNVRNIWTKNEIQLKFNKFSTYINTEVVEI